MVSRVARKPIVKPDGVDITIAAEKITVKGKQGELAWIPNGLVQILEEDGYIKVTPANASKEANTMAGTARAHVSNMVDGVSRGFERKLELVGVGYRAKAQGKVLDLSLGFSHPVQYALPDGVTAETPSQTEIVLKSSDKQLLGQVASEIRKIRPPEPYKGKGVRYSGEYIVRKEGKKK